MNLFVEKAANVVRSVVDVVTVSHWAYKEHDYRRVLGVIAYNFVGTIVA